MVEEVIEVVSW